MVDHALRRCGGTAPWGLAALLALHSGACADSLPLPSAGELRVAAHVQGYLADFEYHNGSVEGRSLLGAHGQAMLTWAVATGTGRTVSAAAGVDLRRDFGDEAAVSAVLPLLLVQWQRGPMALRLGLIDVQQRHGLPAALYAETRSMTPGLEEGAQLLLDVPVVREDVWIAWLGLNTPSHREHFSAGSSTLLRLGPLSVPLALMAEHYGGEQYAPADDPVRENLVGSAGLRLTVALRGWLREVGGEALAVGSYVGGEAGDPDLTRRGWGAGGALWVRPFGIEVGLRGFYGSGFTAWMGDSVYQTGGLYAALSVSRRVDLGRLAQLEAGVRLELIDRPLADYFPDAESRVWLNLRCGLDERLWLRGAARASD